jgi:hypothetical protein
MRHLLGSCLALLLMAAPAPADDRRVTDLTGEFSARGKTRIELRLAPGTIRIEPSPDANVRVNLGVYCAFDELGCEEKAERLALEAEYAGKSLEVRVDGLPSLASLGLNVRGEIRVPRGVALEVDFPAGELTIQGVAGDLNVDAGAGEIRISMREHDVRSVRLGVGIGEASLSVAGRGIEGSGWLGQKVRWGQGDGPSRVAVNLGVGELDVRLD